MEIKDKFLSASNCETGDIVTFLDEGIETKMPDTFKGGERDVINFKVNNGRYDLIYTPFVTEQKEFMKAWGRNTTAWVGKKFQVKIVDSMTKKGLTKKIFPVPIL
jgi:hypothetical protein